MSDTLSALAIAVQARVPVLLWGAPGTGKSSVVRQLAGELNLPVEVVIASVREPSDFAGLPLLTDGMVRFAPPSWAVRLAEAGRGILFLDEISTAPPAVQAALLRVVLERTAGELELPDGVAIVAAANPADVAAGGWELSAPLANRFVHLDWPVKAQRWAEGIQRGWTLAGIPRLAADWEERLPAARAVVARFISARPATLLALPRDEQARGRAWPSPRTWEMAARLVAAVESTPEGSAALEPLVVGCVGAGAGGELLAFMQFGAAWDLEAALSDPSSLEVPESPDAVDALLGAVVAAFADAQGELEQSKQEERWAQCWRVIDRVRKARGRDVVAPHALALLELGKGNFLTPQAARPFVRVRQTAS
ncbi:MAG: ATPase AAA [Tepidiforma sp.]|nr:MAG: ATPase AAA [Tepidiforma sp.]